MKLSDMDLQDVLEQKYFVDKHGNEVVITGYQPEPSYIAENAAGRSFNIGVNSISAAILEPKNNTHEKKKQLLQQATKHIQEAERLLRSLMCEFEDDENFHDMSFVEDRLCSIQMERQDLTNPRHYILKRFPE